MSLQMHFDDHEGFQRNAIYWTVAGAAGALLGLLSRGVLGYGAELAPEFLFGFTGAGLGLASGIITGRWSHLAIGAGTGVVLGVLMAVLGGMTGLGAAAPLVGAAAAGLGVGLLWGPERAPRPARAVAYGLAAVIGFHVIHTLMLGPAAPEWLALPGVRDAAAGGVLGLFLSLGGALGRLRLNTDPVHQLWSEVRGNIKGDLSDLSERSVALYDEINTRLARRRAESGDAAILNDTQRIATETTQRLLRLASRWCDIEGTVDVTSRARLKGRLQGLEDKIKATSDSVVKAEYQAAARAIREQLSSFDRIDLARERLIARIHRCHTSLEQISVKLLHLSTTDAQNDSLGLQPELERLDEMSDDFSWSTLSVDELCNLEPDLDGAAPAPAPAPSTDAATVKADLKADLAGAAAPATPSAEPAPAPAEVEAAKAALKADLAEAADPAAAVKADLKADLDSATPSDAAPEASATEPAKAEAKAE